MAPKHELPKGEFTFYYLELALESKLARKLSDLRDSLTKTKGSIRYDWSGTECIKSKAEFEEWRESMGYNRRRDDGYRRRDQGPREVLDTFKGGEMEEEDLEKKTKRVIVATKEKGRTWYAPDAWEFGGLRLKEEVKDEGETLGFEAAREDGAGAVAKRVGKGDSRASSEGPSAKRARLAGE